MISIITPVYNAERFIGSCIQVVIDQNCLNIEHIIIDGGSTDRTVEIVKQYAEKYSHIRWISEKDKGQSDAMNKGIAMAKGEILGILNVDDFYQPNVLNRILKIFPSLPEPTLLVGNCNVLNDQDNIVQINKPNNLNFLALLTGIEHISTFPYNPSAYFYHTSLHQTIGLYKVDEHYAMDIDFILRAVQVATVNYVDEIWGNFRLIKGTKTFNDLQSGQCGYRFFQILKQYRKQLPLSQQIRINTVEKRAHLQYFLTKNIKYSMRFLKRRISSFLKATYI
ncbi:glycosyltransferase family 2 protein [Calothrix sp. UHCC 0171]|uniref:glycosyltransferase family 2 protein n=1 Tax=Calothrix sp. UHCC 0171 TaxID=3110245 RepID=UPI002B1EFADE|nr:glycosyltransferase family 2 protein [Calothrix sp. UHCC 0171]MEA5573960.1 glycosyltransferase family 2 protein [Calothrix sp. UHCC 0171]